MTAAVRPAAPREAVALAEIHADAFPPSAAWRADALARLMETPGTFALSGGGTAIHPDGFILMRVAGGEAEVLTLAVRRHARRAGLGAALLEAGLAHAVARGAGACVLEVAHDNTAARALYAAHGFAAAGRRRGYYARPQGTAPADALILRWETPEHAENP